RSPWSFPQIETRPLFAHQRLILRVRFSTMRANWLTGVLIAGLVGLASSHIGAQAPQTRKLELSFHDGRVSLAAQGVTVREIMAEWARQCGCVVKDADKLIGAPLTVPVQFDNQPEAVVLASLLSTAAGYIVGPRVAGGPNGPSIFGSVWVFPKSTPVS